MEKYLLSLIILLNFSCSAAEEPEESERIAEIKAYSAVITYVMKENIAKEKWVVEKEWAVEKKWLSDSINKDEHKPTRYNAYHTIVSFCIDCIINLKKGRPSIPFVPKTPEEIDKYRSLDPDGLEKFFTPSSKEFLYYKEQWGSYRKKFNHAFNIYHDFSSYIKFVNNLLYINLGHEALKNSENKRSWNPEEYFWNTEEYYNWLKERIKTTIPEPRYPWSSSSSKLWGHKEG